MTLDWVERWAKWEVITNWIGLVILILIAIAGITYLIVKAVKNKIRSDQIKNKKKENKL